MGIVKKCGFCGREFKPRAHNQIICSPECRREYDRMRARKRYHSMSAKERHADNVFKYQKAKLKDIERLHARWRKANARKATRRRLLRGRCAVCGKKFVGEYRNQKYCSPECRASPQAEQLRHFFYKICTGVIRIGV